MPTALPLSSALVAGSETEGDAKLWLAAERAALAEIGDPMGRPGAIQNLSLVFTVAANALTCNVKTRAGAAPSAIDPVSAALRNATLATGDFNVRNITAALALVISSGSTLGHLSATAAFIYWYLIDNAGALELAASSTYYGQKGIVTTVAEGGAGAADSATVMYSTAARTNFPFICIGRTTDTQATAGTWAAVPSTVELSPFDAPVIGIGSSIVKRKTADESVTSSTALQDDDHLTFAIAANEEWAGVFEIEAVGSLTTTGLQVAITCPAGATIGYGVSVVGQNTLAGAPRYGYAAASGVAVTFTTGDALGANANIKVTFWVLNGATPGNVTLQFAQQSSSATPLKFRRGSFLTARLVA